MMDNALAPAKDAAAQIMERVLLAGDLKSLHPQDRVRYYNEVCTSVGLNPLTTPFEYITLNGKLTLYAKKSCTDQLRSIHGISIQIVTREQQGDIYIVSARATNSVGRADEDVGATTIGNLKGDALCNAMMKAETKAKRRVTLSICGLGMLDETEVSTVPGATVMPMEQAHKTDTVSPPNAEDEQPAPSADPEALADQELAVADALERRGFGIEIAFTMKQIASMSKTSKSIEAMPAAAFARLMKSIDAGNMDYLKERYHESQAANSLQPEAAHA